jgi:hypothetical protein
MTVRTRELMIGKRIRGALAPERHGSQNLCSALVAAVIHVNELAARKRNVLAHLHQRLAPCILSAMSIEPADCRCRLSQRCHNERPLQALWQSTLLYQRTRDCLWEAVC